MPSNRTDMRSICAIVSSKNTSKALLNCARKDRETVPLLHREKKKKKHAGEPRHMTMTAKQGQPLGDH